MIKVFFNVTWESKNKDNANEKEHWFLDVASNQQSTVTSNKLLILCSMYLVLLYSHHPLPVVFVFLYVHHPLPFAFVFLQSHQSLPFMFDFLHFHHFLPFCFHILITIYHWIWRHLCVWLNILSTFFFKSIDMSDYAFRVIDFSKASVCD